MILMVGVYGSPAVKALKPYITEHGMPYIAPQSGSSATRVPFNPAIVNIRASYGDEAIAHATLLVEHLRVRRIACFYQNDAFGQSGTLCPELVPFALCCKPPH